MDGLRDFQALLQSIRGFRLQEFCSVYSLLAYMGRMHSFNRLLMQKPLARRFQDYVPFFLSVVIRRGRYPTRPYRNMAGLEIMFVL